MRSRLVIILFFLLCFVFIEILYEIGELTKDSPISNTEISHIGTNNRVDTLIKIPTIPLPSDATLDSDELVDGYIFIGDSRFNDMIDICSINKKPRFFTLSEENVGYDWLIDDGISSIIDIMDKNRDIYRWNLVLGLGINDLYNINKYVVMYDNLSLDFNLYIVSVNPIEYHSSITNKDIEYFNSSIRDLSYTKYIDTYSYLTKNGYFTIDGVHYNSDTYRKIYKYIKSNLD